MGQRLNLEIHARGLPLANAYYHWGSYTTASLETARDAAKVLRAWRKTAEKNPGSKLPSVPVETVLDALRATGAGIPERELEMLKNGAGPNENWSERTREAVLSWIARNPDAADQEKINRNDGLIALSENGMEETRKWSEGDVVIDIVDGSVDFGTVYEHDKCSESEDENIEAHTMALPESLSLGGLDLDNLEILYGAVLAYRRDNGSAPWYWAEADGTLYDCIE